MKPKVAQNQTTESIITTMNAAKILSCIPVKKILG